MHSSDLPLPLTSVDAGRSQHPWRVEALERELFALRRLRAEVELMQPGLLLDRPEDWHSGAAEHYTERVREVRLGLAGAEHLLGDAERAVAVALELARVEGGRS